MELPRTKLPLMKDIKIQDDRIVGVVDFSRSKDPFDTYRRKTLQSSHLEFVKLGDDPTDILGFINKWGFLSREAVTDRETTRFLIPAILKLNHPIHREIPLPEMMFSLEYRTIQRYRNQVRTLWNLWLGLKAQDPDNMLRALEAWSRINKQSLENLQLYPYPLVSGPRFAKAANKLNLAELKVCTVAAIARSFKNGLTNLLGIGGPFLCAEPIFYDTVNEIETIRMHYHIADLLGAIYCMILADITANREFRSCKKCGSLFTFTRTVQIYCSQTCAQAYASQMYYQRYGREKRKHARRH
jgi:hypothetical protein